jgi:peptidoglycan/xylan/chitin deacetylase (PgdA/CDA1 family)
VVALPALVTDRNPALVSPAQRAAAVFVGAVACLLASRLPRSWAAVAGAAMVLGAAWSLTQLRDAGSVVVVGGVLGVGAGLVAPSRSRMPMLLVGLLGAAVLVAVDAAAGRGAVAATATVMAFIAAAVTVAGLERPRRPARAASVIGVVAAVVLVFTTAWAGANSPSAEWFGRVVSHGPRNERQVALTFDDGPNRTATLGVRDILDRAGVKATFFSVGKALDARPDISRALLDDGQLLGNHSYHHDSWRWLDPRYPELARTQHAFAHRLGVCPAFYRPPHGQHTPFMARELHRRGMTMVTWDVSAADWSTKDPGGIARRVLRKARPGSIILLHDGLDGRVGVDRSVIVRALPAILDGLRHKGLQPVRLDVLLDRPGYLRRCSAR